MCGIFGLFSPAGPAVEPPLDLLSHRGPDSEGRWRSPDGALVLGHTRLAIIDLSPAGAQPMRDETTGNVIVFNGEIYNHASVREAIGPVDGGWNGTSDTETILRGYARFGEGIVSRLKGMFAFILYDASRKRLLVARDRFGIKPLYCVRFAGGIAFASEVRALHRFFPQAPTPATVSAYLGVGACPEEELIFPGFETVPAASYVTVAEDAATETVRYWELSPPKPARTGDEVSTLRGLLEEAVQEHLLADVAVASFLSGGIDSSIITALAARHTTGRLATFSVGFKQTGFDETANAAEVARRFGTDHTRIELREPEVIEMAREAVVRMDLPSVDAINTYVVSKAVARSGIKVALSGLGGDELFGGYPSFVDAPRLRQLARLPGWSRRLLARAGGRTGERLATMPEQDDIAELAAWRRVFWTSAMLRDAGLPLREFPVGRIPDGYDDFARVSWAELSRYMRHMLLRDSDQMSMSVSLELRVPMLDHRLVEYVLSLPAHVKSRYPGVKGLLVESCRDLLPEAVYQRPKMGFGLPMNEWMRGPLAGFVREGIGIAADMNVLPPAVLSRIGDEFARGDLHWTRLWSVVVLGHYLSRHAPATRFTDEDRTLVGRN